MKKVLLYSGGMDSWLIDKIWKPDVKIYINIHGAYSEEEIKKLPSDVKIIDCPFLGQFEEDKTKYIPLRNLYFLMIASHYGEHICFGATAGDYGAIDKRPEFIDKAQDIINYTLGNQSVSEGKQIKIEKKFVYMSKYEIVEEYLNQGGDIKTAIDSTFSCFEPKDGKECLNCKPCFRKFMLGYYFGYEYSNSEKLKMSKYIKENVIPKSNQKTGTYYKDRIKEGEYLEEAVNKLLKKMEVE